MGPTGYKGSDGDDKVETSEINQNISNNSNYNVVSDFESDDKAKENFLDEHASHEVEATYKTTVDAEVVRAMKKFQASYNNDANKIIKKVAQEKSEKENLFFLLDLATIAMVTEDTKPTKDEPQTFNDVWNHSYLKKGK